MRSIYLTLLLAVVGFHATSAQTQAPPQTARQALLEILLDKTPGTLEKHLPHAARKTLFRGGESEQMPVLRELTSFRRGITTSGGQLETFDSGPVLVTFEEKASQQRIEIIVERDDLAGDGDEIELSFHPYLGGKPEPLPVVPRLIVTMKQEEDVWKLDEITVAVHIPLSDPEYLKGLQKAQTSSSESASTGSLRTLNTAQISYSSAFPERGFTCTLATLGGSGQVEPSPEHAMLIDDALASGRMHGYVFSITGCDVPPASSYHTTAVPADSDSDSELRAFCSDESGVIRYSSDGKAATCLSEGVPLE